MVVPRPILFGGILVAAGIAAFVLFSGREVSVPSSALLETRAPEDAKKELPAPVMNRLTGLPCDSGEPIRPIGVMLAADPVARPLSGIDKADMVVEMPVITYGINRFMALFGCSGSEFDIGSVRSARDDFIPLAASFDAIYGHWGGSHFALDELRGGVIDNVDALKNPYGAYFRKKGIGAPHNGFTTLSRMSSSAEKLGYRLTSQESGPFFKRSTDALPETLPKALTVAIGYPGQHRVGWTYDDAEKAYLRTRGGAAEKDKTTNTQVVTKNIIIIRTSIRQIEGQYNDVKLTGEGKGMLFRNGTQQNIAWERAGKPFHAPLRLLSENGEEIALVPGSVWLEVLQKDTAVTVAP